MKRIFVLTAILAALLVPAGASAQRDRSASASVYVYCTHGNNAIYCSVSGTLGNTGQSAGCSGYGCTLYFSQSGSGWGTACGSGYGCKGFGFATGQVIRIYF